MTIENLLKNKDWCKIKKTIKTNRIKEEEYILANLEILLKNVEKENIKLIIENTIDELKEAINNEN